MKISCVTIKNLLSFRDETVTEFDHHFNILVGPNGGGKSNLLDIITVLIRRYFLQEVYTQEAVESGRPCADIGFSTTFLHLPSVIDTFGGNASPWEVQWELVVTEGDLSFVEQSRQHKDRLLEALSRYRNKPIQDLNFVDGWDSLLKLKPGHIMRFRITPDGCESQDVDAGVFLQYLNYREFIQRLSRDIGEALPTAYLYFSPYRGGTEEHLRANLATQRFDDLQREYRSATSRSTTSLLRLGTMHFAKKRRRYENLANNAGYNQAWQADPEVQLVTNYIRRLGYTWDLKLVEEARNVYEVVLTQGDRSFLIEQASSGEREVLGFLMGIFASNMRGGIVVIDEPELHLHPRWQGVLRDLLSDLSETTDNQIIVATHSPSFITRDNIQSVIRVFRGPDGASRIVGNSAKRLPDQKALTHMIMSHNNEKMFFADKVVLVEGIMDRLLFATFIELCSRCLDKAEVIEVLEVHGKDNFKDYQEFLRAIGQEVYIIADLDYVTTIDHVPGVDKAKLKPLFSTDYDKIVQNVVDSKKSTDRVAVMRVIGEAVVTQDPSKIDFGQLTSLYMHMASRHMKLRSDLTEEQRNLLETSIAAARQAGIFILARGEIEDYLPAGSKKLADLIGLIRPGAWEEWLSKMANDPGVLELKEIVLTVLNASQDGCQSVPKRLYMDGGAGLT